jgi:hypothetical protein
VKVFLSWSGDRSRNIAETLRDTLPLLMNAVRPWMSELDIDKGERWNAVLTEVLDSTKVGIFCLTPSNINRPAILFEAGAISKSVTDARVCVLLEKMQPSDLRWPWSQFQCTKLHDQKDMFKMLSDVNKWLGEAGEPALGPDQFAKQLTMWWPEFQKELAAKPAEQEVSVPARSEKDMLVEVLDLLRSQKRDASEIIKMTEILETVRMNALQEARAKSEELLVELRRLTADRHNRVMSAMVAALKDNGHETAAGVLANSALSFTGDGTCTVTLNNMRSAMAKLTFNVEAEKMMLAAAQSTGYGVSALVIRVIEVSLPKSS